MRGGERVLELLCQRFPHAPIFTLIHDREAISEVINAHEVRTSWLQSVPGIERHYRRFLPLFPWTVERMRIPHADLLISTSHCIAKGARPPPGTKHLCYCFTPMRYAWTFYREYFGDSPLRAVFIKPVLSALRAWDRRTAVLVDRFVAISRNVQKRIRASYGRDSDIVYPPVDTTGWTPGTGTPQDFDLIVSALVPYKRIDLAVRTYTSLGTRLKIVGIGSEMAKLRSKAGSNIEFLGWQPDQRLLELYRSCRALIFPGEEDFGIVPLEAQACGRPVVAYGKGGALESVEDGVSGVFFKEQTVESLLDAVDRCKSMKWDPASIRANAERFDTGIFIKAMSESIAKCLTTQSAVSAGGH